MTAAPMTFPADVPLNLYRVSSPGRARVVSNTRLTPEGCDEVRHLVFDLRGLDYRFLEGQSMGVLTPGVNEKGQPNKLRLYSIASTRNGDDGSGNTASLCVKRVVYSDPETGEERRGIASNYLCDLEPGEEVAVTGPSGRTFLLPEDPDADLVFVATGTGIAPFRAFLRRIFLESTGRRGRVTLIFGVRTRTECLYLDELEEFRRFPNFQLWTAFSREETTADGKRLYVQHRIAQHVEEIWKQLERDHGLLYICGLKGMETGINEVLERHAGSVGSSWTDLAARLDAAGRLHIETY
ncbi:MAG: FAD-binding oxidoreductase [Isosphaeraceae bacterium]|nr:FAD-binding oxidoreductase [Isosphaeraceae bacterium]